MEYRDNRYRINNINACITDIKAITPSTLQTLHDNKSNKKYIIDTNASLQFLGRGQLGTAYLLDSSSCGKVVVKMIDLNANVKLFGEIYKYSEEEVHIMKKLKTLIDKNISPNFIYYYDDIVVDNFKIILMEYADGTLEDWIKMYHTDAEWLSFMFQILQGVLVMQKELKGVHSDMKPKNIFFKRVISGYIKYTINDKVYYVPNEGYLFTIADFGRMKTVLSHKNIIDRINNDIKNNEDLYEVSRLAERIMVSGIITKYNYKQLTDIMKKHNMKQLNIINNDIDKNFAGFKSGMRDKMKMRSYAYYIIENNLIDIDKLNIKVPLPSPAIRKQLHDMYSPKPIENMLDEFKIFKELPPPQPKINLTEFTLIFT